ncbi:hypothetical protein G3435_10125 [Pseudomonas sp. MAFF212428]|uniref:TonB-dependent receptor n=1 Tax=Pseudomonas brassicae TaxID=2708063 RepID=A0A6M0CRS9_9PSED|nr:hypothetical protein [Pseudomonas brassicae]
MMRAAQYGSDAIAGVINIVLKENDNGGNLGYRFGGYDKGDGLQRKLSGWKGLALGLGQRVRPVQPGGQQRGRPGRRLHRLRLCHLCTQEHRRRRLLRPAHHADPQLRHDALQRYPDGRLPITRYNLQDYALTGGVRYEDDTLGTFDLAANYGNDTLKSTDRNAINPSWGDARSPATTRASPTLMPPRWNTRCSAPMSTWKAN